MQLCSPAFTCLGLDTVYCDASISEVGACKGEHAPGLPCTYSPLITSPLELVSYSRHVLATSRALPHNDKCNDGVWDSCYLLHCRAQFNTFDILQDEEVSMSEFGLNQSGCRMDT